ncbi:50S ribosomal protein L1, chloroplastic [Glycine soja]
MYIILFPHFWLPLCALLHTTASHPLPIAAICNFSNCIVILFLGFPLNLINKYLNDPLYNFLLSMRSIFVILVPALPLKPLKRDRTRSKRSLEIQQLRERKKEYDLKTAISLVKETAKTKFVETVAAYFCLNIGPKYNDQQLRAIDICVIQICHHEQVRTTTGFEEFLPVLVVQATTLELSILSIAPDGSHSGCHVIEHRRIQNMRWRADGASVNMHTREMILEGNFCLMERSLLTQWQMMWNSQNMVMTGLSF